VFSSLHLLHRGSFRTMFSCYPGRDSTYTKPLLKSTDTMHLPPDQPIVAHRAQGVPRRPKLGDRVNPTTW